MQTEIAELHALIAESMADLEDAYRQFNALEVRVLSAMDDLARDWARDNGWFGVFDYHSSGVLRLAPDAWRAPDDASQAMGWFHLDHGDGDPGNEDPDGEAWDLSRLCQIRSGILCFQAWPEWKMHGLKLPAWKRAARLHVAALHDAGFGIGSAGSVFSQVKIDQGTLTKAVRAQSIKDALGPFEAALDQLKVAAPVVESVLDAAKA